MKIEMEGIERSAARRVRLSLLFTKAEGEYIYVYVYRIGSHDPWGWEIPRSAVNKLETHDGVVIVQRPGDSKPKMSWYSVQVQRQEKNYVPAQGSQTLLLRVGSAFLFVSGPQLTRWGPPTAGWAICFIQFTDSNVHFIQTHPEWCLT